MNKHYGFDVDSIRRAAREVQRHMCREGANTGRGFAQRQGARAVYSHGFRILGSGNFSVVLASDEFPDVVFKYGHRSDDAYFHYALWCRANPNKHAPNILHIEKLEGTGYLVVLPRYREWEEPDTLHSSRFTQPNLRQWAEQVAGNYLDQPHRDPAEYPPSLGAFAASLGRYFENICPLDMHHENVMWDGDTLIITDPVSYNDARNDHEEQARRERLERICLSNARHSIRPTLRGETYHTSARGARLNPARHFHQRHIWEIDTEKVTACLRPLGFSPEDLRAGRILPVG